MTITEELLKELVAHQLIVRVWDSKDKVLAKARSDKPPKAFRLPNAAKYGKSPAFLI